MKQPIACGVGAPLTVTFHAGSAGPWKIVSQRASIGDDLPPATHIAIGTAAGMPVWSLTGFTSNLRYTTREERAALDRRSAPLGRAGAPLAALIPIRKSQAWWAMAQDQRRAIYDRSAHTTTGLRYLPQIARRLHHSRDLGQPFDFLTWFEFAPEAAADFDALLAALRQTEEWDYVTREIDIRLVCTD